MLELKQSASGKIIAFLLPGVVALFSLSFWVASAADAFHTFLTAQSNVGLFLFLLLGALTFGLVVSAVRSLIYETLLGRMKWFCGARPTEQELQRMSEADPSWPFERRSPCHL